VADLLERRWTVSILYVSHGGAVRFNEFVQALGTIPPATLAQRLADRVLGPGDDVRAAGPDGGAREGGLLLVRLERPAGILIVDSVGLHDRDTGTRKEAQRLLALTGHCNHD